MPQPHPGQDWRHGWIPVTPQAMKSKNHGRKPGPNSRISKAAADAGKVLDRMKAQDAAKSKAAKAEKKAPSASKPKAKTSASKPSSRTTSSKPKTSTSKTSASKPAAKSTSKPSKATPAKTRPVSKAAPKPAAKKTTGTSKPKTTTAKPKTTSSSPQPKVTPKPVTKPSTVKAAPSEPIAKGPLSDADAQQRILQAAGSIPRGGTGWSDMADLRKQLGDIPRDQQDKMILDLMLQGRVDLEPIAIRNWLTQEDKDAEIVVGSTPNSKIRLVG